MTCQHCIDSESIFDRKRAQDDLKRYRRDGPDRTTKTLIEMLVNQGLDGKQVLDIGAGIGAVHHELLRAGVRSATVVEASQGYLQAAIEEAERLGHRDQVTYIKGDFVDVAEKAPPVDLVTLDRVICCYPDAQRLLEEAAAHAGEAIGLVYPWDRWWNRAFARVFNLIFVIRRSAFRFYVHPQPMIDSLLNERGFHQDFEHHSLLWRIAVYRK